ncbi:hypothetical protein [Sporolactobacillus terrae]|uniref:hypothetical protein n=1 Tax=Sporolactobacillus terrae TaxID=269673 RepID=UPI00159BEB8B|nr:hypothetical protein [Sporolactobacillus terrae]
MRKLKLMMAAYCKYVIDFKWILLGVLIYLYASVIKRQITYNASLSHTTMNSWDVTLNLLNDIYLILYFIIPLLLLISTVTILVDFNDQSLIRFGSMKHWIIQSLRNFWWNISPLLLIWGFLSLYITIGIHFSWHWSRFSQLNSSYLNKFIDFFQTPLTSFIFNLVFLILVFSLLHLILSLLFVLSRNKHLILLICSVIFLGGIVGYKLLPSKYGYLSLSSYFSLIQSIESLKSPFLSISAILIVFLLCYLFLQVLDLNKRYIFSIIKPYSFVLIYSVLCLMGIFSTARLLHSSQYTVIDFLVLSFKGVRSEDFMLFPFFYYSIVFFGFVYLMNRNIGKEMVLMSYYKMIRFRSVTKWFWSWFYVVLIKIIGFLFYLAGISLWIAILMQTKINFHATIYRNTLIEIIYQFFINGFLQLVFYLLILFIILWISKEPTYGLITISIFMLFLLPEMNPGGFVPVGLNGFGYLQNYSPLRITIILLLANFFAYLIVVYLFKSKKANL